MCFLKPLKVDKIENNTVFLENGIKAYYDEKIGKLHINDLVLVYGNLIIETIKKNEK